MPDIIENVVQSYANEKFISQTELGMKRLRITDPVKCRVELHLLVDNSKFPAKVLRAAHAAVIFMDACKTWTANQEIIGKFI